MRRLLLLTLSATAAACAAQNVPPITAPAALPEAEAGPYRVVVDRITHSKNVTVTFRTEPERKAEGQVQARRTLQLQLGIYAREKGFETGLASCQIKGVTAQVGKRTRDLQPTGNVLDNPNDSALLRAYLIVSDVPLSATEIHAVDGELHAFDRSARLELDIPLTDHKLPASAEKDGVKATLQELNLQGSMAQVLLRLEGAPDSILANTTNDGTYGVSLYNREDRQANSAGGVLHQVRPNHAEYRLSFQNVRTPLGKLRVRVLHRSGPRRVYPFRIQRITIPGAR